MPFAQEFADAEHFARGRAATGPGYESIQTAEEDAFRTACLRAAEPFVRDGLPIRASLRLYGITGTAPG